MNAHDVTADTMSEFLKKHGKETVTHETLNEAVEVIFDVLKKQRDEIQSLKAGVKSLKASHEVLAEKALKGGAAWARGTMYTVNDVAQYDGSLWKCVETHVSGASFSHEHFLLQIKRGRDGKDLR